MSIKKTVAKNAALMMGSQIVTWGMALLLTIFMPRFLGPASMGKFHFSSSIWSILSMLAALGTDTYLVKESARRPDGVPNMIWSSALLRFAAFLVCLGGLFVYLQALGYPDETRQVAFVIGLVSMLWLLISILQAVLVGLEKMQYVSMGNIAGRVVATLVSIAALLLGQKVVVVAMVNILGALITLGVEFFYISRIIKIPLRISTSQITQIVKGGLPYLLSGMILVVYMQFDFVIISLLVDDRTVGWYGVADQLFGTFLFVPTVMMTVVFPVLARMFVTDAEGLPRITRKSFDLLVLLSIPIGLGVIAAAEPTILLLYGPQFAPTGAILSLMGIVIILTYLNVFIGQYLISIDRQNHWTIVMAVATVATLPLDLWLVPFCARTYGNGGLGGALSFILTEAGMLVAGLWLMPRGTLNRTNVWLAVRAMASGLAMLAVTWWIRAQALNDFARLTFIILAGVVVYVGVGAALRIFAPEDVALIKEFALSQWNKFKHKGAADGRTV